MHARIADGVRRSLFVHQRAKNENAEMATEANWLPGKLKLHNLEQTPAVGGCSRQARLISAQPESLMLEQSFRSSACSTFSPPSLLLFITNIAMELSVETRRCCRGCHRRDDRLIALIPSITPSRLLPAQVLLPAHERVGLRPIFNHRQPPLPPTVTAHLTWRPWALSPPSCAKYNNSSLC